MSRVAMDSLKRQNTEGVFISPASEEFEAYFRKVVDELIDGYTLAGIHLDYVRYADQIYDYSEAMRTSFVLEYQLDPLAMPDTGWYARTWSDFRKNQVTDWVQNLSAHVKERKQGIQVSAAVWADLKEAQNRVLQDWPTWAKRGAIDFLVLMNYAADNATFERRIMEAAEACGAGVFGSKIVMGVSLYNQTEPSVFEKLAICKKYDIRGISLFSYETIRTTPAFQKKLVQKN